MESGAADEAMLKKVLEKNTIERLDPSHLYPLREQPEGQTIALHPPEQSRQLLFTAIRGWIHMDADSGQSPRQYRTHSYETPVPGTFARSRRRHTGPPS
jgi:hypothetical protein